MEEENYMVLAADKICMYMRTNMNVTSHIHYTVGAHYRFQVKLCTQILVLNNNEGMSFLPELYKVHCVE